MKEQHPDTQTYIQTYIHTYRQTEPNYYIDFKLYIVSTSLKVKFGAKLKMSV